MQSKSEKLKGYFIKYPFLQNIHFCKLIGVNQTSLKAWIKGLRPMPKRLIEIDFNLFIKWIVNSCNDRLDIKKEDILYSSDLMHNYALEVLSKYQKWILEGYVPSSTILEIIGTDDVMNDFISNCL